MHCVAMKANKKQALSVRCPTCGAKPGEKCELSTGLPRTEPHRDRRLLGQRVWEDFQATAGSATVEVRRSKTTFISAAAAALSLRRWRGPEAPLAEVWGRTRKLVSHDKFQNVSQSFRIRIRYRSGVSACLTCSLVAILTSQKPMTSCDG